MTLYKAYVREYPIDISSINIEYITYKTIVDGVIKCDKPLQLRPWLLVITGDFNGMRKILSMG